MNSLPKILCAAIFLPLTCGNTAVAQTVYRSVDDAGNVTYSSQPPETPDTEVVDQVKIAPPPPESAQKEAQRRAQEMERESARAVQQRLEQREQQADSANAADEAVRKAQSDLEAALTQSVDDWQYLAPGGRVLKPSYLERVERAEQNLRGAEGAAARARGERR